LCCQQITPADCRKLAVAHLVLFARQKMQRVVTVETAVLLHVAPDRKLKAQ
jgi:hypothetical protein